MATIPQGGAGAAGGSGWVRIVDIATQDPGGVVTNKVYQDGPNNTVLQSCEVSHLDITVTVKASYPKVEIGGSFYTLDEAPDGGHYEGDVDVTVTAGPVSVQLQTPENAPGATDTVDVAYDAPPELLTLEFTGGYPGTQTELKAGDTFQLTGTTDKDADAVEIQDYGAMVQSVETFVAGTSFTVTGTIADRGTTTQDLSARVKARGLTGAYGSVRDTNESLGGVDGTNLVKLNNTYPTASFGLITYPGGQQALKGSEAATIAVTLVNATTVVFDSPNGDLSIANPTTNEPTKTCTRISGGYNVSTNNVRVTANRAANDATTVDQEVIQIANTPATINVSAASRLRSGGNDGTAAQNHTITIQSNQQLLSADMDEDVGGGTFLGSWAGGPSNWTRTLQVHDNDTKGTYNWQNLSATNLAGVVTTSISAGGSYVLGGFVARTVTWSAYQTVSQNVNVAISDYNKVQAGLFSATNQQSLKQPIGTPPPVTNGYASSATGAKPHTVNWLDTAAAGSNTGLAYLYNYEETV